jgi:adenylyl-sulfate kinase
MTKPAKQQWKTAKKPDTSDARPVSMSNASIEASRRRKAANVVWQDSDVERAERWDCLGQRGATIWFTGLSGSGKSTTAAAVEAQLIADGRWAYRLDGDNVRHGLCSDLGFSHDDRSENVRRIAEVALLFADAGAVALACLVSPYAADRDKARELHARAGVAFIEVYVSTSLEECSRRDSKGLYARAECGEIADFTGVGSPYEPPASPEVVIDQRYDVETAARLVLEALCER